MNVEKTLVEMHGMLIKIMDKQDEHSQQLENHSSQLKEHGQILNALRSGQEHLKAELDGMKIFNAKEFGELKEANETLAVNQELLRNDSWTNKVDIERIKKTMGMA